MTWPSALHNKSLVLIGYRGVGKTSVGRRVADRLAVEFVDSDEWVQRSGGMTIAAIFAAQGEPRFRELEAAAVSDALATAGRLISIGGGAVLRSETRVLLRARAFCIWLTAPADEIARRLAADPESGATRPALTTLSPAAEHDRLLAERAPLYRAVADATVETAGRTIDAVCDEVISRIGG